ncbi:MmgE/PrpD family protein [uncultured Tateyamaria sp.]|uniref:MmgE/PrpD family protein n=1 Tax=uncultured Tateyamaria sp. TaxID=455651 RepID=UPI002607590F|nr:MmgE/PrpD family protein [uncultured Tateyamaria sp.]
MRRGSGEITDVLLDYAQATPPPEVRDVMALSLLDWAACGIAGHAEGAFAQWSATLRTPGPCVRFDGAHSGAAEAALVNGTLSHALDYDDTHFAHIGHPSVVTCSVALAVAEGQGAPLSLMLDAALVGAEASVAVGLWMGRDHYQVGYHQTATAGAFGATVAAGRLMGLTGAQMRHALGLCASMASGLKAQFGTMGKPLNAGLAARAGVEAAQWAQTGMTAAPDGLAGPLGFGETHHGTDAPVPFDWRMGSVSHKFHACCHGLHAALEAVRGVDMEGAKAVTVHTHPRWLSVCNHPAPETGLGAKFSYAHVLAMAAHRMDTGDIGLFSDACAQAPDLVSFRQKVCVVGDESLSEMQARIDIDGQTYAHDLDAPLPLEARRARIQEKARALAGARADDLWNAIGAADLPRFAQLLTS